ncbi:unnamed protein product [Amaranthus hypochondriacus]
MEEENISSKNTSTTIIPGNVLTENIHQFYFVKFPLLPQEIQKAEELSNQLYQRKRNILEEINSIKGSIQEFLWYGRYDLGDCFMKQTRQTIEYWQKQFETQFPKSNKDLYLELEDTLDPTTMDSKIRKLSHKYNHGCKNMAEERRIIREIKDIQIMKEQTLNYVNFSWCQDRKKYILQRIKENMEELRRIQEKKTKLDKKKVEIEKEILPLENKLVDINQKKAIVNEFILTAKKQLKEQMVYYDENMTLLCHAKKLAATNDLVALKELCRKQVEEFVSQLNNDGEFRMGYERSIMLLREGRRIGRLCSKISESKQGKMNKQSLTRI